MAAKETTDYMGEARDDAADMAVEFLDDIAEKFIDDGEASDDLLNDYPNGDSYHHETHVDRSYSLVEAAELLDDLDDYEETDHGLWEGLEPRRAIEAQAAYTYGNAVMSMWSDLIGSINDDMDLEELRDELQALDDEPDPSEWTVSQCQEWLDSRGVDCNTIDIPDDDADSWREQVNTELENTEERDRKSDELKAAIKARISEIIKDSR